MKIDLDKIKEDNTDNQIELQNFELSPRENNPFIKNENDNKNNFCEKIRKKETIKYYISYITLYWEYLKTFKDINEVIEAIRNYKVSLILVISIFSYFNSIVLFNESLKGCFEPSNDCVIAMTNELFNNLIYTTFQSAVFLSIFLLSCYNEWIDKKWYIIIIFYLPYFFSSNDEFGDHNSYNRKIYMLFLIIDIFSLQIFYMYISFLTKKKYTTFWIISSYFLLLFLVYLIIKLSACNNFEFGIGNISIESDENYEKNGECVIKRPDTCNVDLFENLFRIINSKCEQTENERNIFIQSLEFNEDINSSYLFYYPNTVNFDWKVCTSKKFKNEVFSQIKPILKNEEKSNKEIFLEFDKETEKGKIIINLLRNETLVNLRKNKTKNENLFNNILIIYINSLSRQQFINQMEKTSKILEKNYWRKNKKSNLNSYQFLKYQVFDENNQLVNMLPMFYGTSFKKGNGENIIKKFKNEGFITGGSGNICSKEIFEIENKYINITDFESFDHENFAMFCDPNLFKEDNIYNSLFNNFGRNKNCLYGYDSSYYVFEYGTQFLNKYKKEKKFLRLSFMKKNINALDEQLSFFLNENLKTDNLLIYIMSDNFQSSFKKVESKNILSLDSLFLIISKDNYSNEKIGKNEQKMITPYDIYYSLLNILENKNYKNTSNFFTEINNKRNCETYSDWINKEYCKCQLN